MTKALVSILFALLCYSTAVAQIREVSELNARVSDKSEVTWLGLAKRVFPDAENSALFAVAHRSIALRNLFDKCAPEEYSGEMELRFARAMTVKADGRDYLLVLWNVGPGGDGAPEFQWGETNVLALYENEGPMRLLDAAEVQQDRFASFWDEKPLVQINGGQSAFWIINHHFNSTENFRIYSLLSVADNKLQIVYDEIPGLTDNKWCENGYTETLDFSTSPPRRSADRLLSVRVKIMNWSSDPECEAGKGRRARVYTYLLKWEPKSRRYIAQIDPGRSIARVHKMLGIGG
jgi:hypothetical protein